MNKRWPVLFLLVIFTFCGSSLAAAVPAALPGGSQAAQNSAERVPQTSFNDFFDSMFEGFNVEASPEQLGIMEKLYDDIMELEDQEQYIDAFDKWNDFYAMSEPLWESAVYEYPSFDEYMAGWMPENITAADREKLEGLYNEAVALEKTQEWEAASTKWDEFYKVMEPYWEDEDLNSDESANLPYEEFDESWLPEDMNDTDQAELERLYEEAVTLEMEGKNSEAEEKWAAFDGILEQYVDEDAALEEEWAYPSFNEFYGEEYLAELELSSEDRARMESLYNEAVALEEGGDYEAADLKWEELWTIEEEHYGNYCASYEYPGFDEFLADYPAAYSPKALDQMEQLYNEAVKLEGNGDWEAASTKWDALFYIIGMFYEPCEEAV